MGIGQAAVLGVQAETWQPTERLFGNPLRRLLRLRLKANARVPG